MDQQRFDRFVRALGSSLNRRRFGLVLGGGVSAILLPSFDADAKRKKRCTSPKTRCGNRCCKQNERCQNGRCKPRQPPPPPRYNAYGCTVEDSICDGPNNINNCPDSPNPGSYCAWLDTATPVCIDSGNCVACSSNQDCVDYYDASGLYPNADRALCVASCPKCQPVNNVITLCIIPA